MVLDLLEESGVARQHEIDGGSFLTETTSTSNPVNVVLLLLWQLEVDDETDLLDVDAASKHVGGDQDADGTGSELLHHDFSLLLVHLTVHAGDHKILLGHVALELVHSALRIAVNDGLINVQVRVEVEQDIHLPLLLFYGNVVLVDTFKGQVFLLHQDLGRVPHKVLRQAQDIRWERGREQADLNVGRQELENVLDLALETAREHLIRLVQNEELQVVCLQEASLHHIMHTAWGSHNHMLALLEDSDVLTHDRATDTSMHLDSQVLANRVHDKGRLHYQLTDWRDDQGLCVVARRIYALQCRYSKSSRLSSSRLSLCNCVFSLNDG